MERKIILSNFRIMKFWYLLIIYLAVGITGCSDRKEEEEIINTGIQYSDLENFLSDEMKLAKNDFSVYIFIPANGCEECIDQASDFASGYELDERVMTVTFGEKTGDEIPATAEYFEDGQSISDTHSIEKFPKDLVENYPKYFLVGNSKIVKEVELNAEVINQELMLLEMELF